MEGNKNSKGREGGSKRRQFLRGWGAPGGMSMTGELLINNRVSAEQVFSYFTVTGLQNKYYCLH